MFDPGASLITRLLKSATYTAPALSTARPCGWYRPLNGNTVGVLDPAANSTTRPYMPSLVTNTSPALSNATPPGESRKSMPLKGSTVCPDTGLVDADDAAEGRVPR